MRSQVILGAPTALDSENSASGNALFSFMTDGVCQDPTYKKEQKIQQNSQYMIQYKIRSTISDLINHRNGNHVSLVVVKAFIPRAIVDQGWAGRRPTQRGSPTTSTC